jgi:hypothetical protein
MQIKFKAAYSVESSPDATQMELLQQWTNAIKNSQIKYIQNAKIEFIDYDLLEYYNQEKLLGEYAAYLSTFNHNYANEEYVKEAFKEFSKDFRLLEMVITPDEY